MRKTDGVVERLRQAMTDFDACTPAERAFRVNRAQRVIMLVRELLREVDGERYRAEPEPFGGPIPGVAGSHLPERDDDYTAEAVNRTAD